MTKAMAEDSAPGSAIGFILHRVNGLRARSNGAAIAGALSILDLWRPALLGGHLHRDRCANRFRADMPVANDND